jgi:chemotaxis-related protein WspD
MTHEYLSAAARLLDREVSEQCLAEWTEIISAKTQDAETSIRSAVIFRIGSEWLALPTSAFREVTTLSKIHRLPNRHTGVLNGLVNVRGELLLCASLDVLLGLERPAANARSQQRATKERLLVCEYRGDRLAFPVTEVLTTHNYLLRDMRNVPATLAAAATCTMGVLYWEDKAIGCLDPVSLFQSLNKCFE